jgi:hypothetical protein
MSQDPTTSANAEAGALQGETRTSSFRVDRDGIIRITVKPDAEVSLADAMENVSAINSVGSDGKKLVLVDMRPLRSMSREARQFMAGDAVAQVARAQALLIDSGFSRIIGNFMLGLNKPPYPTRMFTAEERALEWLKGYDG